MDIVNFWSETGNPETDGKNIIKTWLCGGTDGQTYPITDLILTHDVTIIIASGYDYDFPVESFDEIVGFKHDYKLDDPKLDEEVNRIYAELKKFDEDVSKNPQNYFKRIGGDVFWCDAFKGILCDYCVHNATGDVCTNNGECPFKKKKSNT